MPQKETDRTGTRITVRVRPELRDAIEKLATRDRRTVSNWVVLALEDAVAAATKKAK